MCESPHKAAATPFAARRSGVLNKVIHRTASRVQLFSRIQNLAAKLKFYFNFDGVAPRTADPAIRRCLVTAQLLRHAA
ncbi:hypothetical protein BH160DRAFT_0910 [Burkholderia sp. H160]|nr:hypothetical protein BH160DRAFT_0910 [Burkholderia sp. H160]